MILFAVCVPNSEKNTVNVNIENCTSGEIWRETLVIIA